MKQETSKREDVQITEAEIEALVHQFMLVFIHNG